MSDTGPATGDGGDETTGDRQPGERSSPSRREILRTGAGLGIAGTVIGTGTVTGQSGDGVPAPPRNLAVDRYPTGLDVRWVPPADTGASSLTGYRVDFSGTKGVRQVAPGTTECRFDDLPVGTDYTVAVTAVNGAGESDAALAETSTATLRPPSELEVAAFGYGHRSGTAPPSCSDGVPGFSVSWRPPDALDWEAYVVSLDGEPVERVETDATPDDRELVTSIEGLEWETSHTVGVAVDYGFATSEPRTETTSTGERFRPRLLPLDVTATTDTSVTLEWGITVPCYTARIDVSVDDEVVKQVDGDTTSTTLTGLTPGKRYEFDVVPVDIDGSPTLKKWATATTTDTKPPSPPTDLTVTERGPTKVVVDWSPATDESPRDVCEYRVDVGGWPWTTEPGPATSSGVGYLPRDWTGTIGVTAVDCAGNESDRVQISASTETPTDREPPNDLEVVPFTEGVRDSIRTPPCEGAGLYVTWDRPGADGVEGYEIYVDGDLYETRGAYVSPMRPGLEATVTELAYETTYEVAVAADYGDATSERLTESVSTGTLPEPGMASLSVAETTHETVTLDWTVYVPCNVDRFVVYRDGEPVTQVDGDTYTSTVTGLAAETTYEFGVSPVADDGTESDVATTVATTDVDDETPPSPPSALTITDRRQTVVELGWTPATDEGGSDVCEYRVDVGGWPWTTEPADATGTGVGYLPTDWEGTIGIRARDCKGNDSERVTITASTASTV